MVAAPHSQTETRHLASRLPTLRHYISSDLTQAGEAREPAFGYEG